MAEQAPNKYNDRQGPAVYGAAYHGPYRRSTDLPEKPGDRKSVV